VTARRRQDHPAGPEFLRPPVAPMLAAAVNELPAGPQFAVEPKWDGWRTLAFHQGHRVYLQSRSGKNLSSYFPEITRVVRTAVPVGVVLDGVMWSVKVSAGRMSHRSVGNVAPPAMPSRCRNPPARHAIVGSREATARRRRLCVEAGRVVVCRSTSVGMPA
jgi:hypothetical protein